jgi:hypothetical protein
MQYLLPNNLIYLISQDNHNTIATAWTKQAQNSKFLIYVPHPCVCGFFSPCLKALGILEFSRANPNGCLAFLFPLSY